MKTPDRPDWPPEWPLIFIAHAGCERLRAEIDTHLRGVRLRPFEPTPGGARQAQIQAALNQARAAILLIDKEALASDEVLGQMQALLRRHDSAPEAFPIYPVLAGSCTWEASPLAGREVLPLPADRDTLWARIAAELRRALHGPGATLISDPIPGPASQPQEPPPIVAPLGADEIHAWLAFCRGYLVRHCPQELRIVAFLGYELPPERHQGFHDLRGHAGPQGRRRDPPGQRGQLRGGGAPHPARRGRGLHHAARHPGAAPAPRRAAVLKQRPSSSQHGRH